MKQNTILFMLIFCCLHSSAQTWGEWFKQKKTQKKYLIEQIAGLQAYLEIAKKGYTVTKHGLQLVGDIKNGDFKLHNVFFGNLRNVNPVIKHAGQVGEMIALNHQIIRLCAKTQREWKKDHLIPPGEVQYLESVILKLKNDCADSLEEAVEIITDGKLELQDSERISRLNLLVNTMKDNLTFCKILSEDVTLLIKNKNRDLKELRPDNQ